MKNEKLWKFLEDSGTFVAKNPHRIRRLYFPLGSEMGVLSSITPSLRGDIKKSQESFLTPPVTTEDLHDSRYGRNFWVYVKGSGPYSPASGEVTGSLVEAGPLWHKSIRLNKKIGIKSEFLNFVPVNGCDTEIMTVEITNISKKTRDIIPTAAVPIYGRSANRLRDHRHCSALLNRVKLTEHGVTITPTMVFDEGGHKINTVSYFVLGCEDNGSAPIGSFPTVVEFCGESGNLENPEAVFNNISTYKKGPLKRDGKEAMGAIRFKSIKLQPGKSKKYILAMGISDDRHLPEKIFKKFDSLKKLEKALAENKTYWREKINSLSFRTHEKDFDRWLKWVTLQPSLRKIFGCSFLPDFDYGRGGRGWRDLWQDCLTLLLTDPSRAKDTLINNFGGIRPDGSNATIIGKSPGEFISDRNNMSRTWMDHGLWPFKTLNLYINQTGDYDILFKKVPYFESPKKGTILEHILKQHERPFRKIGQHGSFRLEDADWNDGLDMAGEKGESVAFTAAYVQNLNELAEILEKINYKKHVIRNLKKKIKRLSSNILKNEWLKLKSGHEFFNGYYDNKGRRVEGKNKKGVRMTLTGQVFPIMSGIAGPDHIKKCYRSIKKFLWDKNLGGFRLNTDFGEIYPDLGRAFGFAYGEKENGAFFSHMNVMLAYALYKQNFAREGFEILNSIYKMCLNTKLSKIYPGLPEYFNSDGRGLYHYLTGSASWYILTLLTLVFGIKGKSGDLHIKPRLVKEQFSESKTVSVSTYFAGRKIKVNYLNQDRLDFGKYRLAKISINGKAVKENPIKRKTFLTLTSKNKTNIIDAQLRHHK